MADKRSDSIATLSRPAHRSMTAGAELAAYKICQTPLDLSARTRVDGHAIDSADPDSPMDRDDAIGRRYVDDPVRGPLTILDVSIADVASTIPRMERKRAESNLDALDAFAYRNGESLYFSHGVSPMLPRRLQDRLSLENNRERASVSIHITYDAQYHRVHTAFARTYIKTKCKSYRQAARDILIYGDPIQQISVISNQILRRKSGVTNLPHYDPATGMYTDAEGNVRHISRDELSAFSTVQGAMIAANEAAAEIMSGSNFLFRNHSFAFRNSPEFYSKAEMEEFEGSEGRIIQNKAEYSPVCKGHYGLNAEKYSHITSPMRRYADLVNQRMMLWAIDVIEALADNALAECAAARASASHALWSHARVILSKATELKESRGHWQELQAALELAVCEALRDITLLTPLQASCIGQAAVKCVRAIELPYTAAELVEIAQSLNETLANNRAVRREIQFSETSGWLDKVFPLPDPKILSNWGADSFARLLGAAARRGDNHDIFAQEVLQRLSEDEDTLVANLYSILVVAERHKDSHWQELKKEAFQRVKDTPELAENIFAHMQKQREWQPQGQDAQLYILEASLLDRHGQMHPSALVVITTEETGGKKEYCAPIIDTAPTPEGARQAALLTFFRHYGDLSSHNRLHAPRLIELALERATVRRGERLALLHKMSAPHFTVTETRRTPGGRHRLDITLTVTSKEGGQSVSKTRWGRPEDYTHIADKAAKEVLEDRRFLNMLEQTAQWQDADGPDLPYADIMPLIVWHTEETDGSGEAYDTLNFGAFGRKSC